MVSVKPGRTMSLWQGVMAFGIGVFGLVFFALPGDSDPALRAFGWFFVLASWGMAGISLYNAFARNRVSMLDITERGEEPDPLDR